MTQSTRCLSPTAELLVVNVVNLIHLLHTTFNIVIFLTDCYHSTRVMYMLCCNWPVVVVVVEEEFCYND